MFNDLPVPYRYAAVLLFDLSYEEAESLFRARSFEEGGGGDKDVLLRRLDKFLARVEPSTEPVNEAEFWDEINRRAPFVPEFLLQTTASTSNEVEILLQGKDELERRVREDERGQLAVDVR